MPVTSLALPPSARDEIVICDDQVMDENFQEQEEGDACAPSSSGNRVGISMEIVRELFGDTVVFPMKVMVNVPAEGMRQLSKLRKHTPQPPSVLHFTSTSLCYPRSRRSMAGVKGGA